MADDSSRAGGGYLSPAIRDYVEGLHSPHDAALDDALKQLDAAGMPRIHIAPTEGKILALLLRMIGARKVVEFGTLSGYSALWMLKGLPPDGHITTCEFDPKHAAVARRVFERAGVVDRVTIVEGAAIDALPQLGKLAPFDAVFLDADKANYGRYARWAFEHVRSGGLIVGDNSYLFGYLAGREPDANTGAASIAGMRDFHEFVAQHCFSACLPTPDGMVVGLKP